MQRITTDGAKFRFTPEYVAEQGGPICDSLQQAFSAGRLAGLEHPHTQGAETLGNPAYRTSDIWEAFEVGAMLSRHGVPAERLAAIRKSRGSSYRVFVEGEAERLWRVAYTRSGFEVA